MDGATASKESDLILELKDVKPLSADDAASVLEASGAEVLVFRDADTYRVNVVFRRADGAIGLVDPEF